MICYPYDGQRYTTRQHQPACIGAGPHWHPPLPWIDCDGCQPCPQPHCPICTRTHLDDTHPATCTPCLDRVRTDLAQIMQLAATAEHRLANWWPAISPGTPTDGGGRGNDTRLPGGDLLVLVGPGSAGTNNPLHHLDEHHGDAQAITTQLAAYEDQWRRDQHQHAADTTPILSRVMGYLTLHLTWAAQHQPDFPEFAATARRIRGRLEAELRDGGAPMRGVNCFDCGTTLTKPMRDPTLCRHTLEAQRAGINPATWIHILATYPELGDEHAACDQGGLDDNWRCPRCRRVYPDREYWFAVRAAIDAEGAASERLPGPRRTHQLHQPPRDSDRTGDHPGSQPIESAAHHRQPPDPGLRHPLEGQAV